MKNYIKTLPSSVIYSAICLVVIAIIAISYVVRKTDDYESQGTDVMTTGQIEAQTIEFTGGILTGFSS